MNKNLLFIDAETDGLYGPFISVAIIVTDSDCKEIERFYYGIKRENLNIKTQWVIENVVPYLGEYEECESEHELLKKVWEVWSKYKDTSYAIADVCFPVEARLFERCVGEDLARYYEGPFPLLDLSSFLYAKGVDPLIDRKKLVDEDTLLRLSREGRQHNALYDIEIAIEIYKKYVQEGKNE